MPGLGWLSLSPTGEPRMLPNPPSLLICGQRSTVHKPSVHMDPSRAPSMDGTNGGQLCNEATAAGSTEDRSPSSSCAG